MRLFGTFVKRVIGSIALEVLAYREMRKMVARDEKKVSSGYVDMYKVVDSETIRRAVIEQPQEPSTH